jgi:predicted MFS family arabinose efflux permease
MQKVLLLAIGMFALGFDAYVVAGVLPDIGATFKIKASQAGQAVTSSPFVMHWQLPSLQYC